MPAPVCGVSMHICPCIPLGRIRVFLFVPVYNACVYMCDCVLVSFKGDGVALTWPRLGYLQPRRGLVKVGMDRSFSKSWCGGPPTFSPG